MTTDVLYQNAVAVPVNTQATGNAIKFPSDRDKPDCVRCLVAYTPGVANRTLTVTLQVGSPLSASWFTPLNSTYVITGGVGGTPINTALTFGLPGAPSKCRVLFASAGDAGADDTVTAILAGLPEGTSVS